MSNTVLPDEAYYPITRLQRFPKQTRETDPNAARFDPSRPIKLWRDPEVPTGPTTGLKYKTWNAGKRQFQEFTLPAEEARALNIPGEPPYEKWFIEPTPAAMLGPGGAVSAGINSRMLCTFDQAQMLAVEIGGEFVHTSWSSPAFSIDWCGETRRHYTIQFGSSAVNAGLLLADRWKQGVNYPGHWEFTGILGSPQFYPDPIPSTAGVSETPLPYRELVAGQEAIYEGGPMGSAIVYRVDMESIYNPATGTGGADQITLLKMQEDIAEIKRLLMNLTIALGLGG